MIASGAAMRSEANNAGSAVGTCTLRKVVTGLAPYAWHRSSAAFGALRRASDTLTSTGKNVTIPAMIVTDISPRPKINVMIGVIATRGTERSTIAAGMNV